MLRTLLIWGLLAGLCGGLLATGFSEVAGEPAVNRAIAFESAQAKAAGQTEEPAIVTRGVQRSVGLLTAAVVFGVSMGGLFALAFAFAYGRVGRASPARTALWLAAGAFLVVYLVPFLKYPANPPSVGDPDTIGKRTTLYFLMVVLSVLLAVATVILGKRLASRLGNWNATLAACAFFVLAIGLAYAFLPSFNEVPKDFSATLLWQFRLAALAVQLTLWTSFGLVFGVLAERVLAPKPAQANGATRPTPVTH